MPWPRQQVERGNLRGCGERIVTIAAKLTLFCLVVLAGGILDVRDILNCAEC